VQTSRVHELHKAQYTRLLEDDPGAAAAFQRSILRYLCLDVSSGIKGWFHK
jgi:hypothetical protein